MSFPIHTLVVNKADKKHTIGPLDAQVRLVNPDGTPFAAGAVSEPTTSQRGGVLKQSAEADLNSTADNAAIIAKINGLMAKLKAAGVLA